METPEAIIVGICILVFMVVLLCTCMLKSSSIGKLQQQLNIQSDRTDKTTNSLTDKNVDFHTKETVMVDSSA